MIYKVETYDSEAPVIERILQLKSEGVVGDEFFVLAKDKAQIAKLVENRLAYTHTDEDNTFWERIKAFFRGEESMLDKWNRLGFSEEVARTHEEAVENGSILLIMERPDVLIDQDWYEYIPQKDDEWLETMKEKEKYSFLKGDRIEDLSEVPSDLISDVIPTDVNVNPDMDFKHPLDEVPPDKNVL